jgi:hypothetical protein
VRFLGKLIACLVSILGLFDFQLPTPLSPFACMSAPNKLANVDEKEFITVVGAGLAGCMSALLFGTCNYLRK